MALPREARLLYSAALELKLVFGGGPDIWPRSDAEFEHAIRRFFDGTLEKIESILGSSLSMVRYVVA